MNGLTMNGWAFCTAGFAHFAAFLANVRLNFHPPDKAAGALQLQHHTSLVLVQLYDAE